MVIGALFATLGVHVPHIEGMVAASVLVLGLLVAFQSRWSVAGGMSLVGLFAFFHGHAHGLEMPEAASPYLYGLGFVLATVILHVAGIAVGRTSGRWVQAVGMFTAAAGAWFMVNAVST
jgi:urease accessory protein